MTVIHLDINSKRTHVLAPSDEGPAFFLPSFVTVNDSNTTRPEMRWGPTDLSKIQCRLHSTLFVIKSHCQALSLIAENASTNSTCLAGEETAKISTELSSCSPLGFHSKRSQSFFAYHHVQLSVKPLSCFNGSASDWPMYIQNNHKKKLSTHSHRTIKIGEYPSLIFEIAIGELPLLRIIVAVQSLHSDSHLTYGRQWYDFGRQSELFFLR